MSHLCTDVVSSSAAIDPFEAVDVEQVPETAGDTLPLVDTQQQYSNSEWDIDHVKAVYRHVKDEQENKKNVRLQYFMSNHCDKVLHQALPVQAATNKRKRVVAYRSNHRTTDIIIKLTEAVTTQSHTNIVASQQQHHQQQHRQPVPFAVTFRTHGSQRVLGVHRTQSISPIAISANTTAAPSTASSSTNDTIHHPLPPYMFCLPIQESFRIDDQPELSFVPMIEKYDDKPLSRRNILSMHQTSYRENLVLFGPLCQQEDTNMMLDALFQRLFSVNDGGDCQVVNVPSVKHPIWDMIAEVTDEKLLRIRGRIMDWVSTNAMNAGSKMPVSDEVDLNNRKRNRFDIKYEKLTDGYRKLWCRQCFIYDCNMHGLSDKPSVSVQNMLAKTKERDGHWVSVKSINEPAPQSTKSSDGDRSTDPQITELNEVGKSIFKQLFSIFEGDTDDVACMLRVPKHVVEEFLLQQNMAELLDVMPPMSVVRRRSQSSYYSVKNYKQEWYNQYRDSKIFSYFFPCLHDGICQVTQDTFNCSCIENTFFCTDACSYNKYSPNYFRGCNCSGTCTQQCSCYLSKRECDPNLCACTSCTDPPNERITKQKCRNDNLTMNRAPRLLIGRSDVSGWGLFTRDALKTGEYIGKYCGELMSQDEADRRGLIADARDWTYIFLISSDMSIDANRKGNKIRFINHSDHPNIEPKTMFVQGQQEIGLYALCNISEQTELFFDYNSRSKEEKTSGICFRKQLTKRSKK